MVAPFFQVLLAAMAGWVNRSQQDVIEYLQAENRILRSNSAAGVCVSPTASDGYWQWPRSG